MGMLKQGKIHYFGPLFGDFWNFSEEEKCLHMTNMEKFIDSTFCVLTKLDKFCLVKFCGIRERKKLCVLLQKLCMYIFFLTKNYLHAHFLAKFRGKGRNFGSYMRTTTMEDSQGSYNHEEEFIGLHVSMGNVETKSNGRREREEFVTMRSLQREV
jgi:hypothetical protein